MCGLDCGSQLLLFASLFAMAAEAVLLYVDLVIVFGKKTHHLGLKAAIVTWGMSIQCVKLGVKSRWPVVAANILF